MPIVRIVVCCLCALMPAAVVLRAERATSNRPIAPPAAESRPAAGIQATPRGIESFGIGATRSVHRIRPAQGATQSASLGEGASLGATTKISGTPMAGSVSAFRISPDGATAVFIADKETVGRFELYSAPVDGSTAPVKLSAGLPFGTGDQGVSSFQITPDGTRVVFLADPNTGTGRNEVFSAPINGSTAPVRLNLGNEVPITGLGITPNGVSAVFFGVDTTSASGAVEVFRATIGTASSAVQLSDVGLGNALGDAVAAQFSPDSSRVLYAADASADNVYQWHSVPLAATGPGSDVQLSTALGSVSLLRISPDSSRVAYASDENVLARQELFTKPIAGGTRIQLNPLMAGDGVAGVEISADGTRVVYLADQNTVGVNEVYGAQMLITGSGIRLNTAMTGTQFADSATPGPDAATAVYEADQDTLGTHELYRVPMNGSATPSKLHALVFPDSAGTFEGLGTPILGRHAVYPVFGSTVSLFGVAFDGTGAAQAINDPPAAGDALFNVFLPASGKRLMGWGAGPSAGSATRKVYAGPIRSDLPVEQFNVTAAAGAVGVLAYEIAASERYGVYLQDKDTLGKPELFSAQLDSDADGVLNVTDNCPFVANAAQARVVLPAEVVALNNTTFTWNMYLDVRFARGPLSSVGSYVTNATGTLADALVHVDAAAPAAGTGWYYLFAPDCAGRSYQTTLGAQPARDLAPLP